MTVLSKQTIIIMLYMVFCRVMIFASNLFHVANYRFSRDPWKEKGILLNVSCIYLNHHVTLCHILRMFLSSSAFVKADGLCRMQ